MKEPIRVLHVLGNTQLGGAESRIMDLYRHLDRDRVQFDFLVHTRQKGHFDEEIEKLIEERQEARKAKNFARADEIRQELLEKGITLLDTREGVKWKRA